MAYIQIDTLTGGSGTYQASTTYYNTQAGALTGAFATITLSTQYLSVPNGTWWVAMRDANNIGNVIAKSIVVSCTTTTTTTFISPYTINYLSSGNATLGSNPSTMSYTVPSNTNILVLQITESDTSYSTRSGGAPSWNGIPMIEVDYGTSYRSETWYLTHPSTGTLSVSIPNTSLTPLAISLSSYSSAGAMTNIWYFTSSNTTSTSISMAVAEQASTDNLTLHTCAIKPSTTALLTTGTFTYSDNALSYGINSNPNGFLMQYRTYYSLVTTPSPMTLNINTTKTTDNSMSTFISVAPSIPVFNSSLSFPGPDTNTSVTVTSILTTDGGSVITARGICYAVYPTVPTIASSKVAISNFIGTYITNITGLTQNTNYYFVGYATNSLGTAYTGAIAHSTTNIIITTTTTTLPITTTTTTRPITTTTTTSPITTTTTTLAIFAPTVTTGTAGTITFNSVIVSNNQSINNGSTITSYGVVFSNYNSSPTLSDSWVGNAGDPGSGLWNIGTGIGLTPSTFYYIRAFATNGVGTSYGSVITFTTLASTTTTTTITTILTVTVNVYLSYSGSLPPDVRIYYIVNGGGWSANWNVSQASLVSTCTTPQYISSINVTPSSFVYFAVRDSSGNSDYRFSADTVTCSNNFNYCGERLSWSTGNIVGNLNVYIVVGPGPTFTC